jgi:hypothetical protein
MPPTYDIDAAGFLLGEANFERGYPGPVTVPPPEEIEPARCRWNGTAWEDAARPIDPAPLIAAAWAAADAHARAGMDENARLSIVGLMVDPACPAWRAQRIAEFRAWWSALWAEYASVRARILAGEAAAYEPAVVGPCPWSIWQIASAEP